MNKVSKIISSSALLLGLLLLATMLKVNYIAGSWASFFSLRNCVSPLSGAFDGFGGSFLVLGLYSLIRLSVGFSFLKLCINHIPGLFASFYWARNHWTTRVFVPLVCMLLFIIHPIGCKAFVYSLYWLIPICFHLFKKDQSSIFLQSLGSTFIAHAVGSVVWLYATAMPVWQWYALLPVVAIERLFFAMGIFAFHKLISFVLAWNAKQEEESVLAK